MSIVKYTNKKTGVVSIYESTSHYDPETKQSRPIRKYLGREDPITGELIPSSGKRGRKQGSSQPITLDDADVSALKARFENELATRDATIKAQVATIRKLEAQKESVSKTLATLLQELSD